jgi:hypothetical protein
MKKQKDSARRNMIDVGFGPDDFRMQVHMLRT